MKKIITIILVLTILVALGAFMYMRKGQLFINNSGEAETKMVATDPAFPEVEGKLIEGFPDMPVYPGAKLVASAKVNPADVADLGYRTRWDTKDGVIQVMQWYETELPKNGWEYEVPDDQASNGEQVAKITKEGYVGYVAAEMEGDHIEIVVDLRKD